MREREHNLSYVYIKDDNVTSGSIDLRTNGKFIRKDNIVINITERFQRISIYENGLVVCEELLPGQHIFRFNKPYKEEESGVLVFE
jgi:hypothetical protein